MSEKIIIDATDGIMGRVAAYAAKQALLGKEVVIVNCNDVLVTGDKKLIVQRYRDLRNLAGWSLKGPKIHGSPERLVKKAVRGMLPHKAARGREALKKVKCYNSFPREHEDGEKVLLKRELKVKAIKLSKISELI